MKRKENHKQHLGAKTLAEEPGKENDDKGSERKVRNFKSFKK